MTDIEITELHHHPDNPKDRHVDVDELADSIRVAGILQPLLVEQDPAGGYVVLAGNRRFAAAKLAGLTSVPCTVRAARGDTRDHTEIRLMENGHRRALTPMQQARSFAELRDSGLTQTEIARRTGFSLSLVSLRLTLLELDGATQKRIEAGTLSAEDAVAAVRRARGGTGASKQDRTREGHLNRHHPVAEVAKRQCNTVHKLSNGQKIGGTACGVCWEFAIRADERWVIEVGDDTTKVNDGDGEPDHAAVEVAASRRGPLPPLRAVDQREAAQVMRRRGVSTPDIAERLGISKEYARQLAGHATLVAVS